MAHDDDRPAPMEWRRWVPDIGELARQLVFDMGGEHGAHDALATLASWEVTAADHGETMTSDDYQALAILLAEMVAGMWRGVTPSPA